MDTITAIFKIHSIMASKVSKKDSDIYIRDLVAGIMAELQGDGIFDQDNFNKRISKELSDHERMGKKDVA